MKIYLASSWKNQDQPRILLLLREAGHEVYDFHNPAEGDTGFAWKDCSTECAATHAKTIPSFLKAIETPRAQEGFGHDKAALDWAEGLVLLLPCGRSAHLEAGYAAGQGKPVFVYLHEVNFEPELMYLLCYGGLVTDATQLLTAITAAEESKQPAPTLRDFHSEAIACVQRIEAEGYYPEIWAQVKHDRPIINCTVAEALAPFQDFWEALPDSPAIRFGPFFTICDLASEFCSLDDEALQRTVDQTVANALARGSHVTVYSSPEEESQEKQILEKFSPLFNSVPAEYRPGCVVILKQALAAALGK